MALHPKFPKSPYEIADPEYRWFPADEELRSQGYEKLLPPLVAILRKRVQEWRNKKYEGATDTSKALLDWWFNHEHLLSKADGATAQFQYYFGQRESVETVIYLYEVVGVKDKYDLMRFDSSSAVSAGMFPEDWRRFVIKMATGSGKTKVLSLILAWCYFHKLYESNSTLARNFLIITPNIIVLDRIRADFDGLKIFYQDPVLPDNGYEGKNWKDDFQLTVHLQDDVGSFRKTGNIFLTNIHRVYSGRETEPNLSDENTTDYFLGKKPTGKTHESKIQVSDIVRDIDELVVLNDEAHHIHDERLAWFQSIQDIHNNLKQKGSELALQIDVTATPKHNDGSIFVQTVADYPLVEAIYQNVVKHPVIPDSASHARLEEKKSSKFTERYGDFINLGYLEWEKVYEEHKHTNKAILFVMTDDTKNCDDVASYLESRYPKLKNAVLIIHTKNNGDIYEASTGKKKEELEKLRKEAHRIDSWDSRYKAIVSVLMLKEGWDVKNVTTIVGLRPYSAQSNILPEQTLGRGLRRMYFGKDIEEYVSVVGTDAFMNFVESVKSEGVALERRKMGEGYKPIAPLVVEVDFENKKKDIEQLDIELPILSPRVYREYKNLSELRPSQFETKKMPIQQFSEREKREIIFQYVVNKAGSDKTIHHATVLDTSPSSNYHSAIGYFAQTIKNELRLVGGYDILYGKVKEFIKEYPFEKSVDLEDANILRNLSEFEVVRIIMETFKTAINDLTIRDRGEAQIINYLKISDTRPIVLRDKPYIAHPKKSIFNKIVGDNHFELDFATFLERCDDIISFAKNYLAVNFKIDYKNAEGILSNFYPDFIVKVSEKEIFIIETKGREDINDVLKIERLKQWSDDINKAQKSISYKMLYIKQEEFEKNKLRNFAELESLFANNV
ncbi:MAG TPA: DEAD/DEAH box helicase family protein [Patescibacteria group bacterium]|nr:DEAD/DEAH box helicase family protein [Patescibacteria group bacterium]